MKAKILGFLRAVSVALVLPTLMLGDYSSAMAASSKVVSVNQVMHATFLIKKSQMVSSLSKRLEKMDHKGAFFPGDIPEVKGLAAELKKAKFRVKKLPNGFLLEVEREKVKVRAGIEFIDPLAGLIRVGGRPIQLKKGMSYLQLAQAVAPVIVPAFLKKIESKKTGSIDSIFNALIPEARAEEERVLRYERPDDLPEPYEKLLDRLLNNTSKGLAATGLGVGGLLGAYGATLAGSAGSMAGGFGLATGSALTAGIFATAVPPLAGLFTSVGSLGVSLGAGVVGGGICGASLGLACGAVAGVGAVILFTLGGAYLIDSVYLGLSKLDDLDRVGNHLNSILDSCEKSKQNYYSKDFVDQLSRLDEKKVAALKGDDLRDFQTFQLLWTANRSSRQGKNPAKSSQMSCTELIKGEGLEKLRSKGIAVPGDVKPWYRQSIKGDKKEKEKVMAERRERGERALRSLCNAYEGIVRCYSSVPSPYGEKKVTDRSAVDQSGRRALEERKGAWEVYRSLGGSVIE